MANVDGRIKVNVFSGDELSSVVDESVSILTKID